MSLIAASADPLTPHIPPPYLFCQLVFRTILWWQGDGSIFLDLRIRYCLFINFRITIPPPLKRVLGKRSIRIKFRYLNVDHINLVCYGQDWCLGSAKRKTQSPPRKLHNSRTRPQQQFPQQRPHDTSNPPAHTPSTTYSAS